MPKTATDPTLLFKVIESVLCIIGLVMLELTSVFYDKWVLGWLYVGLGGYLIVSVVLLITSMTDDVPYYCEMMFLVVGWLLNLITGSLTIARYGLQHSNIEWIYLSGSSEYSSCELGLGITAMILSVLLLADFITVIWTRNEDDDF